MRTPAFAHRNIADAIASLGNSSGGKIAYHFSPGAPSPTVTSGNPFAFPSFPGSNGGKTPDAGAPSLGGPDYTPIEPGSGRHQIGEGSGDPYSGGDPTGSAHQPGGTQLTSHEVGRGIGFALDQFLPLGGAQIGAWAGNHITDPRYSSDHGTFTSPGFHGTMTDPSSGTTGGIAYRPVGTFADYGGFGSSYFGPSRDGGAGFGSNFLNDFGRDATGYYNSMHPGQGLGGNGAGFGSDYSSLNGGSWGGGGGGRNQYNGTASPWDWGGGLYAY